MTNKRSPDENVISQTYLGKYCDEIGLNFENLVCTTISIRFIS